MGQPSSATVDARVATSAQAIRVDRTISKLLHALTKPTANHESFAAEIASYHFIADLPAERESREATDGFQEEIARFRRAVAHFQRDTGAGVPGLFEMLSVMEKRGWEHQGKDDWWPPRDAFQLARSATLDDYLANIADQLEGDALTVHPRLDSRIRTPQGRIAKAGSSRAILYTVRTMEDWEMPHGAEFCRLAKLCVGILIGKPPEDREITKRYSDGLT